MAEPGLRTLFPCARALLCLSLLLTPLAPGCHGSRILVFPMDGSHWVNMEVLVKELHGRGHQLTVLRQADSWFVREHAPHYASVSVQLAHGHFGRDVFRDAVHRVLEGRRQGAATGAWVQVRELLVILRAAHGATRSMLTVLLEDRALMARLRDADFDLMLTDPGMPAGVLVAHYLHLRTVYNVRWTSFGDAHFSFAPSSVSYVPVPGSGFTDRMGFLQRTRNLAHYAIHFLQERLLVVPIYSDLLQRYFPPGADLLAMQSMADMWLMRVDFVFEFPRPTMPNVAYIGGFQCRSARPLPAELEAFMESSREHGVVVMSLGTLISSLPGEVTEALASAFARLPQKVVWKFRGQRPASLGNNTLLLDWLPQNDLLGHPKTRLFVAHGGTNGLYEALYHGVPVLGLPLLFDQQDNLVRLESRGAARTLEPATLTEEDFLEALRDLLENPSYGDNMRRLSLLHRDQPLTPLDRAVFWIEFVIRHKGAPHLRAEAYSMPWYSYYSLDVVAFLLATQLACVSAFVFVLKRQLQRMSRNRAPPAKKRTTPHWLTLPFSLCLSAPTLFSRITLPFSCASKVLRPGEKKLFERGIVERVTADTLLV
ncbi:UDP glucuronosyltransferase 5 family, polypeptide G2 [Aplochiton taeniatus]